MVERNHEPSIPYLEKWNISLVLYSFSLAHPIPLSFHNISSQFQNFISVFHYYLNLQNVHLLSTHVALFPFKRKFITCAVQ